MKKDINYLKKYTNSLSIRIFIEKFLIQTGLKLDLIHKTNCIKEVFKYIFRIVGDRNPENIITFKNINKNSFFNSKKNLIKNTFINKTCAILIRENIINLTKESNDHLHFSEKDQQILENGEKIIADSNYYTSLLKIQKISDFNYSIKLNK